MNFNTEEDWRTQRLSTAKALEDNVPYTLLFKLGGVLTLVCGDGDEGCEGGVDVSGIVGPVSFIVLCEFEEICL